MTVSERITPRMSSLVRRSLGTTAAAAGIAAVSVGLAGPAFAAPEFPLAPDAEGTPSLPSTDGVSVPGVINFEMPSINTAASELAAGDPFALQTVPEFGAPDTDGVANVDADQVQNPSAESLAEGQNNVGQNPVGAMAALDMAALAMELAQSAAAGESVTEGQQID